MLKFLNKNGVYKYMFNTDNARQDFFWDEHK